MNQQRATCRAVTRPGESGARIHPAGCRVRYRVQADNSVRKEAKSTPGQLKPAKQTVELHHGDHFRFMLRRSGGGSVARFMWDTGASNTSMSEAKAKQIGLLTQAGNPRHGLQWGSNITTTTADGSNFVVAFMIHV